MSLDFKSELILREVVTCTPSCGDKNYNSNNRHDWALNTHVLYCAKSVIFHLHCTVWEKHF